MNTAMTRVIIAALPALSDSKLTYNPDTGLYLTPGYTSRMGNTYFRAIRFSERLLIYYEIGQGYSATFINGITLYAWNGRNANIIARREWGGCTNYLFYSENLVKQLSVNMLKDYLAGQAKMMGEYVSDRDLLEFSSKAVEETHQKRIA